MRKKLRNSLVIGILLLLTIMSGPADASPLRTTTARAYGASVNLLSLGLIPPTPPNVQAGPGPGTGSNNLLTVPLGTLVSDGTVSAKAQTTLDSTQQSELPAANTRVYAPAGAPKPAGYNAKAYARVDGLVVAASDVAGLPPEVAALFDVTALISADVIHAEALVACVAGSPVIVGGSQLAGVSALGSDLTPLVDGTLNQTVVPLGNTVLGLLGGSIIANQVVASGPDNLSLNALHIVIPNILDVVLAHVEVTGATCEPVPECSDGIDNDGDGRIDIADPECHTDGNADNPASYDPNDNSEAGLLPRTGGDGPLLGVSLLGLGLLALLAAQKLRRSELG